MTKTLGVLMLDTRFPRPPGDIGNPDSFTHRVLYRTIEGASASQAVRGDPEPFLDAFVQGGRALAADGATLIATSCGFLSLFQERLSAALPVPVLTSSLVQIPAVEATLPKGARIGLLTIDADALTEAHLRAAKATPDTPIIGLETRGALARTIFDDLPDLDEQAAEAEMIAAATSLIRQYPRIGAIVMECTNMGPYATAVSRAAGVPVYSILDAIDAAFTKVGVYS